MPSAAERREALKEVYEEARVCERCALSRTRTNVVFGAGNADADLMFVGEAPGLNEDRQGLPFVGQAGKLLDTLLGEIDLARGEVFIANILKCRPPNNRDPLPGEIESCRPYLLRQIELIEPRVICTLGNFSTKLLRDDSTGITRVHGKPEVRTIGERAVRLYPIFHPAAALYTRRMLDDLREDFKRLPELLAMPAPEVDPAERGPTSAELRELLEGAGVDDAQAGERDAGGSAAGSPPAGERGTPGGPAPAGGSPQAPDEQLGLF